MLVGKERHDTGRPNDAGYPIRGICQGDWLYIRNFENDRWPAGNPETGYLNCDGGPTKTEILNLRRSGQSATWWEMAFGMRPSEEFYNLATDPDCASNVIDAERYREVIAQLKQRMEQELKEQGDPRMFGRGEVFDNYPYSDTRTANFYERFMSGEKINAGWVNKGDFEPK